MKISNLNASSAFKDPQQQSEAEHIGCDRFLRSSLLYVFKFLILKASRFRFFPHLGFTMKTVYAHHKKTCAAIRSRCRFSNFLFKGIFNT